MNVPVIIKMLCQPRLRSRWLSWRSTDEDSEESVQYLSYDGNNEVGAHATVKMSGLEQFLEDNNVTWADLGGDISL